MTGDQMTGEPMTAIRTIDLTVTIKKHTLLDAVNLTVEPGEWVSIIGPNGAGKSTLLRSLTGFMRSTGSIEIQGRSLSELDNRTRARMISWVPQKPEVPVGISVHDYVLLGRTPHLHPLAREKTSDLAIVADVLQELDLARLAGRTVDTLSGGELQRAAIARALAQQAPIILLDEPTAALDLGHQQEVLALLNRIRSNGDRTIITTMHDLTLAGLFADRIVLLACGQVAAQGSAIEVLTEDNLERYYGAKVRVSQDGDHVLVTPRLLTGT